MKRAGAAAAIVAALALAAFLVVRAMGPDVVTEGEPAVIGVSDGRPGKPEATAPKAKRPKLPPMACDPGLANCVVAGGEVIFVEAVDPDGDGDAHFVTLSEEDVTGGGLTVFDVREDLRPDPLPGIGDYVGGLGPVYTGSHGQKQIEVTEFHVAR